MTLLDHSVPDGPWSGAGRSRRTAATSRAHRSAAEPAALAELWTALAVAAAFEGRLRDAVSHAYRALGVRGAPAPARQDARAVLAATLALGGDDDAAREITVRLSPGAGARSARFALAARDGLVAASALDGPRMAEAGARVSAPGGRWERAVGATLSALAAVVAGEPVTAVRLCAPVLAGLEGERLPPLLRALVAEVLALAHLLRGDAGRALTAVGGGRDLAGHVACVPGVDGIARLALGDAAGALRATDGCLHQGARHGLRALARPLLVRAVAYNRLGEDERARLAAQEAIAIMTRGSRVALLPALGLDPRELVDVLAAADASEGLLIAVAALPSARAGAEQTLPQLTRRETVVALLLREDLTLPEIGRRLCVSPNTVKTQVRGVYAKLGATSRAEAVSRLERVGFYAIEHTG